MLITLRKNEHLYLKCKAKKWTSFHLCLEWREPTNTLSLSVDYYSLLSQHHSAIGVPMFLVGGNGSPLLFRSTDALQVWKTACSAGAPFPVGTETLVSIGWKFAFGHGFLFVLPTFAGLASSMIWVMEAGGRMGLKGASSAPDGGCSFTFID